MILSALLLALEVRAQSPAPAPAPASMPVTSTDTVSASTGAAPVDLRPEAAPAPAAPAPPPKPVNPIQVRVHPDAKSWEPVSVAAFAEPEKTSTHFSRRLKRHVEKPKAQAQAAPQGEGGVETSASVESDKPVVVYKGEPSRATSAARVHAGQDEGKVVIVSVYPKALAPLHKYLEARFLIQEGYLEEAKVAAVTVASGADVELEAEDSYTLGRKGIAFREDFPASAKVWIAAISLRPGGLEAGNVDKADFADKELRLTTFGWNTKLRR